jgi:hypothetical protein
MKYQYDLTLEAKSETEAIVKMQSLVTLAAKLTDKELSKLAHVIKHDPVKTALAKKYLGV